MAYERHDVFNIGDKGLEIASAQEAEQLARDKFSAAQEASAQALKQRQQESIMAAMQAQIERKQELDDRQWQHENVTMPSQKMAMMQAILGEKDKDRQRSLEEDKFSATLENREYTRSYNERKAARDAKTKREEFHAETEQEKAKHKYDLDKFDIQKMYDYKKHMFTQGLKDQKEQRVAQEQARQKDLADKKKALQDIEKKKKEAQKTVMSGDIYDITASLTLGKDLEISDIANLKNVLSYYTPEEKVYAREKLDIAYKAWQKEKLKQVKQEEAKHAEASEGYSASFFGLFGNATGQAYIDQKMAPLLKELEQKNTQILKILNSLDIEA